ncbi:hypothetical protein Bca4012_089907 [Brassica carinata]
MKSRDDSLKKLAARGNLWQRYESGWGQRGIKRSSEVCLNCYLIKKDKGYSHNIYPCAGEVEIRKCLLPEVKHGPGRQKKPRWQSWLELSRFREHKPRKLHKDYSCSNCKQPGHTRRNCNQPVQ